MAGPTVSVVIDNFNYARYVGAAIESALAQTYGSVEVVVVDDGSTDGSRRIIESFGAEVVAVSKENGGQASCFNAGLRASTGEIVVFLDADDLLLPHAVEELVPLFEPGVVQAHWPLWVVDGDGARTGGLKPDRLLPEGNLLDKLVDGGPRSVTNAPTSGNAWARTYLERVLPIPEDDYRICADAYLYTLAPVLGEVRRSLAPLGCWRFHGENNYNGSRETLQERMRKETARYDLLAGALHERLREAGIGASMEVWRERNGSFRRMERVLAATAAVEQATPAGATVVLVDDGDWSDVFWAGDELVTGRKVVRLFDGRMPIRRDPLTDDDVIAEVERLRATGAGAVVFVWPGSWWLRHYAGLREHLETRYRQALGSGMLTIYDLTAVDETLTGRAAVLAGEIESATAHIERIEREIRRREIVQAVRRVAHRTVPTGGRVAVVSRGDEALVRLHERTGWHFPQTEDGVYAGEYPASDAEATAQLEALRNKGAEYLLFPSTAFWWLEHYAGFRDHLEGRYQKVAESEDCVIYELTA